MKYEDIEKISKIVIDKRIKKQILSNKGIVDRFNLFEKIIKKYYSKYKGHKWKIGDKFYMLGMKK